MSDCLTTEQIARYRSGAVASVQELLALDVHLAGCQKCREAALTPAQAVASTLAGKLISAERSDCLEYEDRVRYVDGALDRADREIVEAHLEACAPCAADVEALRRFAEELKTYDWSAARQAAGQEIWWRSLFGGLQSGNTQRAWQWGLGTASVLLVVACYGLIVRPARNEANSLRDRLAQEQRQNVALQHQLASATSANASISRKLAALDAQNKQIARQTQELTAEVQRLQTLANASKNVPDTGTVVASVTDNGKTLTLDTRGQLTGLPKASPAVSSAVSAALGGKLPTPPAQFARLVGTGGMLMGSSSGGSGFSLRSPVGTAVRDVRPVFKWKTAPGAVSYAVTVVDDEDQSEAVSGAVGVSSSHPTVEWALPPSSAPLKRGRLYRWFVVATRGDGTVAQSPGKADPAAKFTVLAPKEEEALRKAEEGLGGSRLARGTVYVQFGLLDNAEAEFAALRKENPTSPLARKLLEKVRALRR